MVTERILVIEDEPGARSALSSLLTEEGYTVCTAESGRDGLDRFVEFHPDTVVCDFQLPDIDGLTILRSVRAMVAEDVVFILLTGGCGGEEAESAVRREADYFFAKPVDLPRFRRVLRHPSRWRGEGRVRHASKPKGTSHERV